MKNKFKKAVAGVLIGSTLGFAACTGNPSVSSAEVSPVGDSIRYVINDTFDVTEYVLNVKMSDGSTKQVAITNDMVVAMPDMSTTGEKVIKIKYLGVEYELKITVTLSDEEMMIENLRAFFADYNSMADPSKLSGELTFDYSFNYLGNKQTNSYTAFSESLTRDGGEGNLLYNYLFQAATSRLADLGKDIEIGNVTDGTNLEANLDLLNTLTKIRDNYDEFELAKYFMDNSNRNETIKVLVDGIMSGFAIDESNNPKVITFVNTNYTEFMDYVTALSEGNTSATFDYDEVLSEFKTLINNYSTDEDMIYMVNQVYDSVAGTEDGHLISSFIEGIVNGGFYLFPIYQEVMIDEGDMISISNEIVNTSEANILANNISLAYADIIYAVEDLVINAISEEPTDVKPYLTALSTNIDAFIDSVRDVTDTNPDWKTYASNSVDVMDKMNDIIKNYVDSQDLEEFMIKNLESGLLDALLEAFDSTYLLVSITGLDYEHSVYLNNVLSSLIIDAIKNDYNQEKISLDCDDYLQNLVNAFELDVELDGYIAEWNETGFCSLFSDLLADAIGETTTDEQAKAKAGMISLVQYLEDSLRTKGSDVVTFDWDTFRGMLNQSAIDLQIVNESTQEDAAFAKILKVIELLTNDGELRENVDISIEYFKEETKYIVANIITSFVPFNIYDEESEEYIKNPAYEDAYFDATIIADHIVERYLAEDKEIDYKYVLKGIYDIAENYGGEESVEIYKSMAFATMIVVGKDKDINYNELFDFIELPAEIESIDYNKMVETFWSENTYENLIDLSDIKVKYELDEQGNISKEILEVKLSFNYDLLVTSLNANCTLKLTIDL